MKTINCHNCQKHLFEVADNVSGGGMLAIAAIKGFIPKNPILYTGKNERLVFCTKPCVEVWRETLPKKPEVTQALNEIRDKIPEMAKQTADSVHRFHQALLKIKANQK